MGTAEAITTALNGFFLKFNIPVYPEDSVQYGASLPYLTVLPVIPGGWNEEASFHARLWYPVDGGRRPITQKTDEISVALAGGLTILCEGGAIVLRKGTPWAQQMDNPPEGYLCEYLNFEITQLCE